MGDDDTITPLTHDDSTVLPVRQQAHACIRLHGFASLYLKRMLNIETQCGQFQATCPLHHQVSGYDTHIMRMQKTIITPDRLRRVVSKLRSRSNSNRSDATPPGTEGHCFPCPILPRDFRRVLRPYPTSPEHPMYTRRRRHDRPKQTGPQERYRKHS